MPNSSITFPRRAMAEMRRTVTGPQGLAFVPALTLAAYWLGGEGLLLAAALGVPGIVAAGSLLTRGNAQAAGLDRLTGLPLRDRFEAGIDDIIVQSPSGGGATACLAIGIDDFGRMAAQLGQEAADSVVSGVVDRVLSAVRDTDEVARIDTEILGLALSPARRTDLETLIRIAGRVQAALTEPFSVDGTKIFISVSVGIAPPARLTRPTGAKLVTAALTALAAARVEANGTVRTFSDTMTPPVTATVEEASDLVSALESGAFEAWYQPVIDMQTRHVLGFEALARWRHTDRGILKPADFMDHLTASGLSQRLTDVMLYDACNRLVWWDQAGMDVPRIWLNLSQDDLLNPRLPDKIEKQLRRFDLVSHRFGFDICEGSLRTSTDTLVGRNLRALSQLGFDIVLDQFGSSPVSIKELRRYAIGSVKIDRAVTRAIDRDSGQAELFEACLDVAQRLSLKSIAVGIENAAEHARALSAGCDALQGQLISKAIPPEGCDAWLRKYRESIPVVEFPTPNTVRKGLVSSVGKVKPA